MPRLHHVTSVRNRESIRTFGLDWTRMGAAPGIAGSRGPEVEGCFLCVEPFEVDLVRLDVHVEWRPSSPGSDGTRR